MTDIQFWDWFLTKRTELEKFVSSNTEDYSIYNELVDKLKSYCDLIIPELTQDTDNNNILILSCDGRRDGIEYVEQLFESAPAIDKWRIQKFRGPGHVKELNYQGLSLKSNDFRVEYDFDGNNWNIQLFINGYKETDGRYKGLAFLYLDHFVGEYNVMTKIGQIEFKKLGSFSGSTDKLRLQELRAIIEGLN